MKCDVDKISILHVKLFQQGKGLIKAYLNDTYIQLNCIMYYIVLIFEDSGLTIY